MMNGFVLIHFLFRGFGSWMELLRGGKLGNHGVGETARLPQESEHPNPLTIPGLLIGQMGGQRQILRRDDIEVGSHSGTV